MAQVTIYLKAEAHSVVREAAEKEGLSLSKWASKHLLAAAKATGWPPTNTAPPSGPSTVTCARWSGVEMTCSWNTCSRWLTVSMNPPVPGLDASRKLSGETSSALPVVRITCPSETFWAAM